MMPRSGLPRTDEDVFSVIESVVAAWKAAGEERHGYVVSFDSREKVAATRSLYRASMVDMMSSFQGSTGCDLGCWFGFSSLILASLGPRRVYGIEIQPHFTDVSERWRIARALDNLQFRTMRLGVVPLQTETMDWVIVNQVLCNAFPDSFSASLAEAYRALRPGGVLVLSDSNNPYCQETIHRLERTYLIHEIGDGTPEEPRGANHLSRMAMIKRLDPCLSEKDAALLARSTCYMWGDLIEKAVRDFRLAGCIPNSPFAPRSLRTVCNPLTGAALGNITDPYALCREAEELGFIAHITVSPSWQRLDNDVLYEQLRSSQGFYIYGIKPESRASRADTASSRIAGWRKRLSRMGA